MKLNYLHHILVIDVYIIIQIQFNKVEKSMLTVRVWISHIKTHEKESP